MTTQGESLHARLGLALLKRYPHLADGLGAEDMSTGIDRMVSQWLVDQQVADLNAALSFDECEDTGAHERRVDICLALEVGSVWLEVKRAVQRANGLHRNLGWSMLTEFDNLAWPLQVVTPWMGLDFGANCMWYGETTQKEFIKAYKEMNYEPGEGEPSMKDVFGPQQYTESFDDPRVLDVERPRLKCKQLRKIRDGSPHSWAREFAGHVLALRRLSGEQAFDLRREYDRVTEPMAVVRWEEDDALSHVLDEQVQDNWNGGDTVPFLFLRPIETTEQVDEAIETFESGFRRLNAFLAAARFIGQE